MKGMIEPETIDNILNRARWAPSGDNTQPWRFERIAVDRFRIHSNDTRDWCVYDLEGRASQIAVGALFETIALAAGALGIEARFEIDSDAPETRPIINVALAAAPDGAVDPLQAVIEKRTTQRRPFSSKRLAAEHKSALEAAVGPDYRIVWIEGTGPKLQMARLLFRNAHIRLTIKEAYEVHKRIIEWDAQFSEDRIPDQALGLDAMTVKSMRWAMASWERVQFLNRWFAGTWLPRLQMDLLPGLGCAAHFLLVARQSPADISGYMAAGRAVQRLWLACASDDIQFQPEQTPIIFADYARKGIRFSSDQAAIAKAEKLRVEFNTLAGEANVTDAVFAGRVGYGTDARARSLRLPLARLLGA
ncbi:MAG: molybdopterin biosynthesis protein MoeY [Thiohalocapsa sp. PB-PSB1]|jgi:nitroreductase|nr:MAG: hypothetical protein N838_17285 [Thiohalocapsa sp. PB-PSB1]QQO57013.1 MAG: molybdopterin biosynthesis protein MoeY [Thiohalocapsa sp. PB-PSB1]HCS92213.1 molybdopterin biosynthesis protein MoeY [Chromatiaceae bacterium]